LFAYNIDFGSKIITLGNVYIQTISIVSTVFHFTVQCLVNKDKSMMNPLNQHEGIMKFVLYP